MQLGIVDLEKELGTKEADHMGHDIKKPIDPEIYYNMLKYHLDATTTISKDISHKEYLIILTH